MAALILSGFILVITMLATMARFGGLRRWLGYAGIVDVAFTILMFLMFHGSFSGIVSGAFAGLFMTTLLYVLRASYGYEKLERVGYKLKWVAHAPKWRQDHEQV